MGSGYLRARLLLLWWPRLLRTIRHLELRRTGRSTRTGCAPRGCLTVALLPLLLLLLPVLALLSLLLGGPILTLLTLLLPVLALLSLLTLGLLLTLALRLASSATLALITPLSLLLTTWLWRPATLASLILLLLATLRSLRLLIARLLLSTLRRLGALLLGAGLLAGWRRTARLGLLISSRRIPAGSERESARFSELALAGFHGHAWLLRLLRGWLSRLLLRCCRLLRGRYRDLRLRRFGRRLGWRHGSALRRSGLAILRLLGKRRPALGLRRRRWWRRCGLSGLLLWRRRLWRRRGSLRALQEHVRNRRLGRRRFRGGLSLSRLGSREERRARIRRDIGFGSLPFGSLPSLGERVQVVLQRIVERHCGLALRLRLGRLWWWWRRLSGRGLGGLLLAKERRERVLLLFLARRRRRWGRRLCYLCCGRLWRLGRLRRRRWRRWWWLCVLTSALLPNLGDRVHQLRLGLGHGLLANAFRARLIAHVALPLGSSVESGAAHAAARRDRGHEATARRAPYEGEFCAIGRHF